jgi:hypothetical protein
MWFPEARAGSRAHLGWELLIRMIGNTLTSESTVRPVLVHYVIRTVALNRSNKGGSPGPLRRARDQFCTGIIDYFAL